MNSVKVLHPTGFNNPLILPPAGADKAYKYSSVAVGWAAFFIDCHHQAIHKTEHQI